MRDLLKFNEGGPSSEAKLERCVIPVISSTVSRDHAAGGTPFGGNSNKQISSSKQIPNFKSKAQSKLPFKISILRHNHKPMNTFPTVDNILQAKPCYDLEERTFKFAKRAIRFSSEIVKTVPHIEITKQFIRAAGSVGANYIEANESNSKREFTYKIAICRKEVKEARYWLKLMDLSLDWENRERGNLIAEATELLKIFAAIILKSR